MTHQTAQSDLVKTRKKDIQSMLTWNAIFFKKQSYQVQQSGETDLRMADTG